MDFSAYSDAIMAFVREHEAYAAPVVFALAFGESLAFISLLLPFWALLVAIGSLIASDGTIIDFMIVWVAASLGAAFGDWVSYWLGDRYQNEIASVWPLSRNPELIPRGHAFFEKYGAWAILIGRFFGPLRASVPLVAGIVRMPWVTFQIANFASAFVWAGVLMLTGTVVFKYFWNAVGWVLGLFGAEGWVAPAADAALQTMLQVATPLVS